MLLDSWLRPSCFFLATCKRGWYLFLFCAIHSEKDPFASSNRENSKNEDRDLRLWITASLLLSFRILFDAVTHNNEGDHLRRTTTPNIYGFRFVLAQCGVFASRFVSSILDLYVGLGGLGVYSGIFAFLDAYIDALVDLASQLPSTATLVLLLVCVSFLSIILVASTRTITDGAKTGGPTSSSVLSTPRDALPLPEEAVWALLLFVGIPLLGQVKQDLLPIATTTLSSKTSLMFSPLAKDRHKDIVIQSSFVVLYALQTILSLPRSFGHGILKGLCMKVDDVASTGQTQLKPVHVAMSMTAMAFCVPIAFDVAARQREGQLGEEPALTFLSPLGGFVCYGGAALSFLCLNIGVLRGDRATPEKFLKKREQYEADVIREEKERLRKDTPGTARAETAQQAGRTIRTLPAFPKNPSTTADMRSRMVSGAPPQRQSRPTPTTTSSCQHQKAEASFGIQVDVGDTDTQASTSTTSPLGLSGGTTSSLGEDLVSALLSGIGSGKSAQKKRL
ncbi:unnamed protein product [Amoebophrya sp. A25]|nr:unnamed protein product [Amoebophrya sp. A25]|eukprot:GSA25T00004774001.1